MKLIIHIGTEKTGSSSLQLWGARNRDRLKEDGVFYSKVLGDIDHRKASVFALEFGEKDDGFNRYQIMDIEGHEQFKINVKSELKSEVDLAKSLNCSVFFVSSEHLHSRMITIEMVEKTKELFAGLFDEIEILAYIRPQADLLQSRLSVGVRNNTHSKAEIENIWKNDHLYFNYNELWKRWSKVFEHVIFKSFNDSKNIILDVSKTLNIDLANYPDAKRVNEKLDYRVGLLTFHMRKYLTQANINKTLINIYIENSPCEYPITISRNLASRINAFYRESNLALCKVNSTLQLHHLESDIKKFEVEGTADKMFEDNVDIDFVVPILIRNGLEIHLQKCEGKLIEAERALARNNNENAKGFKTQFDNMMQVINNIELNTDFLSGLSNKIQNLKNRMNKLHIG